MLFGGDQQQEQPTAEEEEDDEMEEEAMNGMILEDGRLRPKRRFGGTCRWLWLYRGVYGLHRTQALALAERVLAEAEHALKQPPLNPPPVKPAGKGKKARGQVCGGFWSDCERWRRAHL